MEKYRFVLVNERGYSLTFEVTGEPEFIEKMAETIKESSQIVAVRSNRV